MEQSQSSGSWQTQIRTASGSTSRPGTRSKRSAANIWPTRPPARIREADTTRSLKFYDAQRSPTWNCWPMSTTPQSSRPSTRRSDSSTRSRTSLNNSVTYGSRSKRKRIPPSWTRTRHRSRFDWPTVRWSGDDRIG